MIYSCFRMFGEAFNFGWSTLTDLVEACGMTKAVFIGLLISLLVLGTIFGTIRARAFSGGEKFEEDVDHERYRMKVRNEARKRGAKS